MTFIFLLAQMSVCELSMFYDTADTPTPHATPKGTAYRMGTLKRRKLYGDRYVQQLAH